MTEKRILKLRRKLQEARYAALKRNPTFAAPLLEMLYVSVNDVPRMSTNGSCIYINPNWLQSVGILSLEFMLAHQQMHISLGHIDRSQLFAGERYHLACDVVANSHLRDLDYTFDQLPGVGRLYCRTFYPIAEGKCLEPEQAFRWIPFDPDALKDKKAVRYMIDSETWWSRKKDRGENGIILLSPDDDDPVDLLIDRAELRENILKSWKPPRHPEEIQTNPGAERDGEQDRKKPGEGPGDGEQKSCLSELRRIKAQDEQLAAMEADMRIWQRPNDPRLDWKLLLDTFLQEQLCDYSFLPPDKRQADSDFFLPDFNETETSPQIIVFAVDTSGSIEEELLSVVYAEICGALEQFDGKLSGVLLFFDTRVYHPVPFSTVEELENARPFGGGGTDFSCLFSYLASSALNPASIVIFTDGQGDFPDERAAGNIPVLWLLSREDVEVPWGRCAILKS